MLLRTVEDQYEAVTEALALAEGLVEKTEEKKAAAVALLAEACLYAGDLEKARELAQKGRKLDPRCPDCSRVLELASGCLDRFNSGLRPFFEEDFQSLGRTHVLGERLGGGVVKSATAPGRKSRQNERALVRMMFRFPGGPIVVVARVKFTDGGGVISTGVSKNIQTFAYEGRARVVPGAWRTIRTGIYAPKTVARDPGRPLSRQSMWYGGPYDWLEFSSPEVRRNTCSFAIDSIKVYALEETVSGKRVIWRDFFETLRHGSRTGHLVFPGPKGARGGVVAFPLGSGDGRFTVETCRYDSNETLAVVRYYVESSKTGKVFLGMPMAGNPVELSGTPGRWHEAVVSLGEKRSGVQYLGSSLWVQTEGFERGETLYLDELRLLEK